MKPSRPNTARSIWSTLVLLAALAPLSCANGSPVTIGPGDGGRKDGESKGDGACGGIDEPCCAPPTQCDIGAFCNDEQVCKSQHPNDIGHSCSSPSQCLSGICGYTQGLGDGGPVVPEGGTPPDCPQTGCTVGCFDTTTDCLAGWTCDMLSIGEGTCTCTCAAEICDGEDNNCDGVIDNEPATDKWCTAQMMGIPQKCVKGMCQCVHTCDDTCVDLENDPDNCGKCNKACTPTVEKCAKGECVCAYSTCDGKCVNTMGSDNANCGKCGKACDYQCTMGSCGPATIPTPDLNEIGPIVTDDTNVYWLGTTSTGFEVEYCPLAGCTGGKPTTLADTNAASSFSFFGELSLGQLTVSASTLYFADDDLDVLQCALPPTGCALTPTTYSTNADFEETYVAATSTKVYWANNEAETVYDCAAGASCVTPTLLQNDTTLGLTPEGMFVTDSAIYWGAGDEETTINIYSAALTGGAVSTVCTQTSGSFEGGNLTQLIVAGGFVYFSDGESTIYSCSATATGATAAVYIMDSNGPGGLAASATDLYWADSGFGGFSSSSTTPTGAIRKCALGASCPLYADGGTSAITVVDKIPSPDGLAVGTTQVYWTSDNMDMPQVNYFSK